MIFLGEILNVIALSIAMMQASVTASIHIRGYQGYKDLVLLPRFIPRGGADGSSGQSPEIADQECLNTEESLEQVRQSEPENLLQPTAPTNINTKMHYQNHRHMTRSDERAILGRAVLTTPHRRMPAIRIAAGPRPPFTSPANPGPVVLATPIFVTKFSLCESLGCALRDLRVIDQFSTNGRYSGPAFLARSNCVIVNVGHVRAIVMRNQVLIFLPEVTNGARKAKNHESSMLEDGIANVKAAPDKGTHTNEMMGTIECLVEALVTHLNSIYHSSHHLMFDEEGRNQGTQMKLSSRDGTTMGQQWGSWYSTGQSSNDWIQPVSSKDGSNSDRKEKKRFQQKNKKGKTTLKDNDTYLPTSSTPAPPFELVVIEALLGHVCSYESSKVAKLIQTAKDVLEGITYNFSEKEGGRKKDAFIEMQAKLGELLPLKNKVDEIEAKCAEVASAIAEVLKNDEDMAAMRLSEIRDKSVLDGDPDNLHVEVELLFEDYLLQMDEVLLSLRSVQSSVRNTEEVVEIELDLLRNRIMRYEMLLELSGLVVGVAAAVTGAFGMNLVNHFEEHPSMFYNVSAGLVVFMFAMGYGILRKLSIDNIL